MGETKDTIDFNGGCSFILITGLGMQCNQWWANLKSNRLCWISNHKHEDLNHKGQISNQITYFQIKSNLQILKSQIAKQIFSKKSPVINLKSVHLVMIQIESNRITYLSNQISRTSNQILSVPKLHFELNCDSILPITECNVIIV